MPKLVSIKQHKLRGTLQKSRHEGHMAPSPGDLGEPQEWFSPEAGAEWERITKDPQYSMILAPAHRGALIEYCHLYGVMIADAKGEGKITASERQMLNSLRMGLGLTPVSAAKIVMPAVQKPNKFQELAGR